MGSSIFPPVFRTALRGLVPGPTSTDVSSQRILRADGVWVDQPTGTLPSVTGNSGRLLTNNGTVASWTPAFTVDAVSGAAAVAAQGSNQNITLTPSGTGILAITAAEGAQRGLMVGGSSGAAGFPLRVRLDRAGATWVDIVNLDAGSASSAGLILQGEGGSLNIAAHSTAHSVWPDTGYVFANSLLSGGLALGTGTTAPITFITNNAERARLSSGGNLLVGTTTDDGVNRLQVSGGITSNGSITALNGTLIASRSGANDAFVRAEADAGRSKNIDLRTTGARRWIIASNATAESGSNAGSNFQIQGYSDADALLGTWLSIVRATGVVNIASTVASSSTTTGALTIGGGLGVAGDVYAPRYYTSANTNSGIALANRSTGGSLTLYADGTTSRWFWNGADRLTVDTSGAVAIPGNLNLTGADYGTTVAGQFTVTTNGSATGLAHQVASGNSAGLRLGQTGVVNWNIQNIATTGTLDFGNTTARVRMTTNGLDVLTSTASTSTTSGALTVAGGVGIAGAVNAGSVTASGPFFTVSNTTAAGIRGLRVQTSASDRWVVGGNGTAESGSNAGTDFQITAYNDAGAFLSTPLAIARATGTATFSAGISLGGKVVNSATSAVGVPGANGRFEIGSQTGAGLEMIGRGSVDDAILYNGSGTTVFRVPSGTTTFSLPGSLRVNTTNGTAVDLIASATATLDFPSISAGASADLTITVTGATVGDSVHLGLPSAPTAGIIFQGFVSAANTVTVRATNITGSPVDPASATYRATVMSF